MFLESARADDDPLYAGYTLVLALGLRKGEVLGLLWDDLDLDGGELTMGRQLQRVRHQLLHEIPNGYVRRCQAAVRGPVHCRAMPSPDSAGISSRGCRGHVARRSMGVQH